MEQHARPWRCPDPLPAAILRGEAPLTPLQVQILANRHVTDPAARQAWLRADATQLHPPELLPDLSLAVARIRQASAAGEQIAIVGDCDVDGLTATAIMVSALRRLGASLLPPLVAPRLEDGRGLTADAAQKVIASGAQVCITVDNGSSSVAEVQTLAQAGIAVIITDHHHIPDPAPAALALVNPQRASSQYPNLAISGAGVAWQVARALLSELPPTDSLLADIIALAGMGTQADIVALTAENHALVALALRRMQDAPLPGIQALLTLVGNTGDVTARTIGYVLAPRINAAGRMGDPLVALDLLLTADPTEAARLAQRLQDFNVERQVLTETMVAAARSQALAQTTQGAAIIFVAGEGWPVGMVGLVAGRLSDEFDRLAVVVAVHGTVCRASLRSPGGFHIAAALGTVDPPLAQFGGHAQAGGFSTTVDQLDAVRDHLTRAYQDAHDPVRAGTVAPLAVDISLSLDKIDWERAAQVSQLAPFGPGFPEPLFVSEGVNIVRSWAVGAGTHLKLVADHHGARRGFFWRKAGARIEEIRAMEQVDIVWHMPDGRYRGEFPEPVVVAIFPV